MKALQMSLQKSIRGMKKNQKHAEQEREKSRKLHNDAILFVAEHPHVGKSKDAMWAIARVGIQKATELASKNLSSYHFRKAVANA